MEKAFSDHLKEFLMGIVRDIVKQVLADEMENIVKTLSEPNMALSDLIDYNTAAITLGVSKPTIHNYINAGKLTKYTIIPGGKPYLSRQEIMKMMKKQHRIPSGIGIGRFIDSSNKTDSSAA